MPKPNQQAPAPQPMAAPAPQPVAAPQPAPMPQPQLFEQPQQAAPMQPQPMMQPQPQPMPPQPGVMPQPMVQPQPMMQPGVMPMPQQPMMDPNMPTQLQTLEGMMGSGVPGQPDANGFDVNLGAYNWGEVQAWGFQALLDPQTTYEFEVKQVTGKRAKTDNSEQLEVILEVMYPEMVNGVQHKGTKLWDHLSLKPEAIGRAKSFLAACEQLSPDGRFIGQSVKDCEGYIVRARIRHDNWGGETRNKIAGGYTAGYETPGLSGGAAPFDTPVPPAYGTTPVGQPMVQAPPGTYVQQPQPMMQPGVMPQPGVPQPQPAWPGQPQQ